MNRSDRSEKGKKRKFGKKALHRGFFGAAAIVVFITTYMLILPAIAQNTDVYCGKEEHTHTDTCYTSEKVLTCTLEESAGHTHTDACYTVAKELVCGQVESTEHQHTDACYKETKTLTCTLAESEGHTHTDACYTEAKTLTCTKEEHTHTAACYSNPNADLETENSWSNTFKNVQLTGNWAEDLVSIAKTQLGYKESANNYKVAEDGTQMGYTRYGVWSGDAYADWDASFITFCMHYAGIPENADEAVTVTTSAANVTEVYVPISTDCQAWIELLNTKSAPYYYAVNDNNTYTLVNISANFRPAAGDIIFFNTDDDAAADHAGIITSITYNTDGTIKQIETIEGNSGNCVKAGKYASDDATIMGYARLPENPNYVPNSTSESSAAAESTAESTAAETTAAGESAADTNLVSQVLKAAIYKDSSYKELSDDQTAITVTGNLPENAYVQAYPVSVNQNDFAANTAVLRAYDITIFNQDGSKYEPADGNSISVNIEIPGLENMADPDSVSVYYVPEEGAPEEIQAEASEENVSFDAEHFSTYAVTANTADNTIVINGVTYTQLANYTETVTTGNSDHVAMLNTEGFSYNIDFTLDNTTTSDHYYVQLPANAVLKEVTNAPIVDSAGNTLAYYTVNNTTDADGNTTSYILITPAEAATQMKGSISASGTATKEGLITFNQGGYIYVIPSDSNYNSLTTSKSETGHTKNEDGSYTIYFKIVVQNTGDTDIKNLYFVDAARLNLGGYALTYTVPVSTDTGAPEFKIASDTDYSGDITTTAGYNYYFIGTPDNPATIPANTTYTYTSSATVSAKDFAKIEEADTQVGTSNSLRTYYEDTNLRENYAWVNWYPASIILSKKALSANITDESTVIPWQISYNENSRFNTSDAVITDTIQENAYASGDGIHYLTDYPVTATIMRYGNSQSTIQLTWVEVDDLDNIENPDAEHIYYCGNSFKYFPSKYSGWGNNYGVVLQYYTNYDKELSPTANEAQANFVDIKGAIGEEGEVIGVETKGTFDSRIQINKMLDAQNDDNTAEWTVVSSINSTSVLTGNFLDNLPCNNDSSGKKLVSTTEKLVNDQKIYANSQVESSDSAYIIFHSVAEFEEVTGIKITVTDRVTGEVLDKEAILCGGNVAYTDRWGHTSEASDEKVLLFYYDTKSDKKSYTATFMIVPNIPLSVAEKNLSAAKYATSGTDGGGYLPSNERAGTSSGYNITFTYTTDTSNATDGETRRNYMTHSGNVVETGDNFNLKAQAYYVKTSDDNAKSIDKELAKVVLQEDGSYRMTYVTLLDNRNLKTTSSSFNTIYWDDVLSGIEGAQYVEGSLDVYTAHCYLNDDSTGYLIDTYSSLEELEAQTSIAKIIDGEQYNKITLGEYTIDFGSGGNYDLTELITVSSSDDGFRFTMNTQKAKTAYNNKPQLEVLRYYKSNAVNCWQSFYLVYDVIVPASQVNSGVLRNTVTRYLDGTADVSAYNEFSMLMKELQKKETQHASSDNDYYTKYELDVNVDDKLKALDSFTIQDVMSDNLSMDVTSMVITYTDSTGEHELTSDEAYTARFANGSLTLIFYKPVGGDWPLNYKITYRAKVTGDGPVTYENSAWIPEIGSTPQTIETSTYITEDEIGDKQVSITIQKYDGNDLTGGGLKGAKFKLERLTNEAQQDLLKQNIATRDDMDEYLSSLPDSSWTSTNVPQPQETSTAGEFTLTSSTDEAVYSNVVYRLKETTPPDGFVKEDVHRYFMIYSPTADETQTGVTAAQAYAYIFPYVDQKSYVFSYQIPNYKANFSVYKTDRKGKDLIGAEFTLYSDEDCTKEIQTAIPTVDDDGRTCYNFKDLGIGTYYVKETKAPAYYILSDKVVKVTVNDDGTITFDDSITKESDSSFSLDTVDVYMSKDGKAIFVDTPEAYSLPESGGMGTTTFTITGLLMMAAAAFVAVLKQKGKTGKM